MSRTKPIPRRRGREVRWAWRRAVILAKLLGITLCVALLLSAAPRRDLAKQWAPTQDYREMPGGWLLCYNGMTRTTRWTLERIDRNTTGGPRTDSFRGDPDIPEEFRALPSDYDHSGYDRGHQYPAGDAADTEPTFLMSNMAPQTPGLNRGTWKHLEEWLRQRAKLFSVREIWIVTAPAWLPALRKDFRFSAIGEHRVWIPTHCLKAALIVLTDGGYEMRAWRLANIDEPDETLQEAAITVDEFESITGLNVFPGIPGEKELEAAKLKHE